MWKFYAPFKFNQADFSAVLQLDVAAVCKRGGFIGDLLDWGGGHQGVLDTNGRIQMQGGKNWMLPK